MFSCSNSKYHHHSHCYHHKQTPISQWKPTAQPWVLLASSAIRLNSGTVRYYDLEVWFTEINGRWTAHFSLSPVPQPEELWCAFKGMKTDCATVACLSFWIFMSSSVQSLSHVRFFATPWTAACQASLSITNSQSPPKPMSIESVMPSSHLILCGPLLLLPSIFPSIRVFSNESALCIRWPKDWSLNFNISPSSEHPGLIFMSWVA